MDTFDIDVKVGFGEKDSFLITIFLPGSDSVNGLLVRGSDGGFSLTPPAFLTAVRHALERSASSRWRILLDLEPPELFSLSWESLLPALLLPEEAWRFELIRFSPTPDLRILGPVELPLDVLIASTENKALRLPATRGILKHFRPMILQGVDQTALYSRLREQPFEVVHLAGLGEWQGGEGTLSSPKGRTNLNANELAELLTLGHSRLLILQGRGEAIRPMRDLGQRLLARGGPPTLLVSSSSDSQVDNFLAQVYRNISHDLAVTEAVGQARRAASTIVKSALFASYGDEDVLRISTLAPRLTTRINTALNRGREAREEIAQLPAEFQLHGKRLDKALNQLEGISLNNLDFERESGAIDPMREATKTVASAEHTLASVSPAITRVVNSWFSQNDHTLSREESLAAGEDYRFNMYIGRHSKLSHVRMPLAIPEEVLATLYEDGGVELRVILFSNDFTISEPEQRLLLPRPPFQSGLLQFQATAPDTPGTALLRASIYYRHNLLQSLRVMVSVTEASQPQHEIGNFADVDFVLSGTLRQIERLPERTLNILTNESLEGTHNLAIVGTDICEYFELGDNELRSKVDAVRKSLQTICGTPPEPYRFGSKNRGNRNDFINQLVSLAYLGYTLYTDLVAGKTRDFGRKLRTTLASTATIQISVTRSTKAVFPWALVYDRPLVRDSANDVCPALLSVLDRGGNPGFLSEAPCFVSQCPHAGDTNIICPSGFWGLRHIIEQPLSKKPADGGMPGCEVDLEIQASGTIAVLMAVSRRLEDLIDHEKKVRKLKKLAVDLRENKRTIGEALQRQDLNVVYFYCHGGRSGSEVWLGIGDGEHIFPTDFAGWDVDWPNMHPLVFINGCHTVDMTPDDLLQFNRVLAWSDAAGVIGTEISIPEPLARRFAEGFLAGLIDGGHVGNIVRRERLLLLEDFNLLGFAYTPYCHAGLHVVNV